MILKKYLKSGDMGIDAKKGKLMDVESTSALINNGHVLVLSGEEELLAALPKGKWIGGTIPYFYLESENGKIDKENIFVTDFTDLIEDFKIESYSEPNLANVCVDGFDNGFNFLIIPSFSDILQSFALKVKDYENLYQNPLIGLVAGVDLEESDKLSKTFNGLTQESFTTDGVVLHAKLPSHLVARLEMINVFETSQDTTLEVEEDGFIVENCIINGEKVNLYEFIKANDLDISYPLVSDYSGAMINISFQKLDDEAKTVHFYAPLFKGKEYKTSKKFESYVDTFKAKARVVQENEQNVIYNCNCILNYLYGELDKNTIGFSGATTFGEIAYQLVNQTFTYLAIDNQG